MSENNLQYVTPNLKYDHVFVICRYDPYISQSSIEPSEIIERITVVKILASEEAAILETDRLNNLILSKKISRSSEDTPLYFMRIGKVLKGLLASQSQQSPLPSTTRRDTIGTDL